MEQVSMIGIDLAKNSIQIHLLVHLRNGLKIAH